MRKKLICLFLSVLMLLSAFPVAALADDVTEAAEHTHTRQLVEVVTSLLSPEDYLGKFTCADCGKTYYAPITPEDVGMPMIDIGGSLLLVTKQNTEDHPFSYSSPTLSFDSTATLKVQGNTSTIFPKKNYTVKLITDDGEKNKVKLVNDWGKQSKYCLKANYVDYSQARNIVSARIFNQIVHSRGINDELNALPNGGVIDGFPVLVYNNGRYLGLYTMNIPKDNWMFGMKSGNGYQALLFGDDWTNAVRLRSEIPNVNKPEEVYWDIEFCSTEDDPEIGTAWVCESMNRFINFLINNNGEAFKAGIGQYTDVDRAIDVLIYTYFAQAKDNSAKNIIWATYDGTKWIPSVYDLDATWGLNWDGKIQNDYTGGMPGGDNLLFDRLLENYADEIVLRYRELRSGILSEKNIIAQFAAFFDAIPDLLYTAEAEKWPLVPDRDSNNFEQICDFVQKRASVMDQWFVGADLPDTPDTPDVPDDPEPTVFTAAFDCGGKADVYVYPYQDYSLEPQKATSAVAVDSDTGEALTNGDGQINFLVVPHEGYEVSGVSVSPNRYKNIKGPEDTGRDNTYRITKITGDITVTVGLTKSGEPEAEGYRVSFEHDDTCTVLVYPGQDYTAQPAECSETFSLDADSGSPTKNGKGQVNFAAVPAEGYAIRSVTVSPDSYKNIKGPEDTENGNTYRITKITGDLTVRIETERIAPAVPTICINASATKIDVAETAVFRASVSDLPEGASVKWSVSGSQLYQCSDDGLTIAVRAAKAGSLKVTAVIIAADGSILAEDSREINVGDLDLFDKIGRRFNQVIKSINFVQILKDALNAAIKSEFWKYF